MAYNFSEERADYLRAKLQLIIDRNGWIGATASASIDKANQWLEVQVVSAGGSNATVRTTREWASAVDDHRILTTLLAELTAHMVDEVLS